MITTKLSKQLGIIDIEIRTQEIVKDTDIVAHLINIEEMENIINKMTDNIILLNTDHKDILQTELLEINSFSKCSSQHIQMDIWYDVRQ